MAVVSDEAVLDRVRRTWYTARLLQEGVKANLDAGMSGTGGVPQTMAFADLSHSLVLLFAFSVLEDLLKQVKKEHELNCRSQLKPMMKASRSVLPWANFDTVDEGRECRNRLAHEQVIPPRKESWKYIEAIEAEFIAWEILDGPIKAEYTITRGQLT